MKEITRLRMPSRLASELAWPDISWIRSSCWNALISINFPKVNGSSTVGSRSKKSSQMSFFSEVETYEI